MRSLITCITLTLASQASADTASGLPTTPPERVQAHAARDSSRFLPRWLDTYAEGGVGWLASPVGIRRRYEAGQGFALGLETRPRPALSLRLGADVQILPARGEVVFDVTGYNAFGEPVAVTMRVEARSKAWLAGARAETGWRVPGGLWLFAGGGGGFFESGFDELNALDLGPGVRLDFDQATGDGWTAFATAGAAYDLRPLFSAPIALDVHVRSAVKRSDDLVFWTIRVAYLKP